MYIYISRFLKQLLETKIEIFNVIILFEYITEWK
jgi:hypothetical protein